MTAAQQILLHKLLDASNVARSWCSDKKLGTLAADAARAMERLHDAIVESQPQAEQPPPF
jgi:hypothetical protein